MSEGKIQLVGLSFEELEQWTLGFEPNSSMVG